jgi:hypothetical protein
MEVMGEGTQEEVEVREVEEVMAARGMRTQQRYWYR